MKTTYTFIFILLVSCASHEDLSMHDEIIQQDLHNKQAELVILRELHVAQINQDTDARKFFMQEYMRVPRLRLTLEQKQHPEYKPWLSDEVIKSGEFMSDDFDYININ